MTAREAFTLIVRVLGVISIGVGLVDLGHVIAVALGAPTASQYPLGASVTAASVYGAVGLVVLLGASLLTRLVYGREPE